MECYNAHGNEGSGDCKEEFFRERTSQHLELQVKERQDDTKQLLQRMYQKSLQDTSSLVFSQEELIRMMNCLEEGDEAEIQKLLESPEVRHTLTECLSRGDLLDYVLDSWTPWWQPELVVVGADASAVVDTENTTPGKNETLDEKLVKVPPLSSLHKNPSKLPDLQYDLLDILYATCWTLRLYYGYNNALESCVDAAETLVGASLVLSANIHWESLPEVLMSCSTRSTQANKTDCNASSSCLVNDVVQILENQRFIGKALFEAADLFRAASLEAKRQKHSNVAAHFRKGRKKVEFFTSWCREPTSMDCLDGLSTQIETWSADWGLAGFETGASQDFHGNLRISSPAVPSSSTRVSPSDSLLRVISTERKL
jgi:hypothetical protein